jgi:hypothetical protein
MRTPGAPDPLYVAARRGLLDALEALRDHVDAVVLVGAQAVYLHTGEGDLAVAPYTTDADIALDPGVLGDHPLVEELLASAEFQPSTTDVGSWHKPVIVGEVPRRIVVDLLVPASLGGPGRRAARIPPHHRRAARKVHGLEGALVDRDARTITALEETDDRAIQAAVAGPGALLVAKLIKLHERVDDPGRLADKDALDVFRLLQAIPTAELMERLRRLEADPSSRAVVREALPHLDELFGDESAPGSLMAVQAAGPAADADVLAGSAAVLARELLAALR